MVALCDLWITFDFLCHAMKNYSTHDRRDSAWTGALHGDDAPAERRFSSWLQECNALRNVPVYGARCPYLQDRKMTKCPHLQGMMCNIINVLCALLRVRCQAKRENKVVRKNK
jgi:hypothetical protein